MKILNKSVALMLATTMLAGSAFADDNDRKTDDSAGEKKAAPAPQGFDIAKMMAEMGLDQEDILRMAQSEEGKALAEMAAGILGQMMAGEKPGASRREIPAPKTPAGGGARGFDPAKLMQGLGLNGEDLLRMAQSEEGKALAEMAAGALGQMMSGEGEGGHSFDLSALFGEDGGLSDALSSALSAALKESTGGEDLKAGITMLGKGVIIGPDGVRHEIDFGKNGVDLKELEDLEKGFLREMRGDAPTEAPGGASDDAVVEMLMEISEQLDLQTELLKLLIDKLGE